MTTIREAVAAVSGAAAADVDAICGALAAPQLGFSADELVGGPFKDLDASVLSAGPEPSLSARRIALVKAAQRSAQGAETSPGALTALKAQLDDDLRKLIAGVELRLEQQGKKKANGTHAFVNMHQAAQRKYAMELDDELECCGMR